MLSLIVAYRSFGRFRQASTHLDTPPFSIRHHPGSVIALLGTAAALWGGWLERVGPRKAGLVAAVCWSSGQLIAALGIACHQLWPLWLGFGAVGGIGLGLGYILPVSTLMKWFPDRRGIAGGLAVMGFGGGAMISAPLSNLLMNAFETPVSVGVWQTFIVLGAIYFAAMVAGALSFRLPPVGWHPPRGPSRATATANVHFSVVHRTVQFWLLWSILCLNVSAGIGMLGIASLMLQEVFGGQLLGLPGLSFLNLSNDQRVTAAGVAAGFTGLLSLFNIAGRLFWAALSDRIGRKAVFYCFSFLGIAIYAVAPNVVHAHETIVFAGMFCVLISMFGGAFVTMPAYVADIFGPAFVSAIQGRILTAWSIAGIVGPALVNYMRESNLDDGLAPEFAYDTAMYILAGLFAAALLANAALRPLQLKWLVAGSATPPVIPSDSVRSHQNLASASDFRVKVRLLLAWCCVGLPLVWGVSMAIFKTLTLFDLYHSGR